MLIAFFHYCLYVFLGRLAVGGRVGVDFQTLRLLIYHGHAAMLALSTFAHNRQNPMKGLLPELLLLLYDQTIVKVTSNFGAIHVEEIPFFFPQACITCLVIYMLEYYSELIWFS